MSSSLDHTLAFLIGGAVAICGGFLALRIDRKPVTLIPTLAPEVRERLSRRVKMLKWILVTAFGYQGYRNARFGRIECHEAINAYARALIGDLIAFAESRGYRALHSLVDSLWLVPGDLELARLFGEETGKETTA